MGLVKKPKASEVAAEALKAGKARVIGEPKQAAKPEPKADKPEPKPAA